MTAAAEPRHYPVARVLEAHDADTLKLDIDCGLSIHGYAWIRLRGVRAPELSEPDGPAARQQVLAWLATHAPDGYVSVDTFKSGGSLVEIREQRTFVRYVGVIRAPDGANLNQDLLAMGYIDRGE